MRVGLSFNDTSIKLVVLGGKPQFYKIALEKGILEDGVIKDEEKFKNALTKFARQIDFAKGEVVFGVAERHMFSKTITVADHDTDLEEKVRLELEDYVPAGVASYSDWQILEKGRDSEKVFVASVPASFIDPYLSIFKSISIKVLGIEPLALSLARHIPRPAAATNAPAKPVIQGKTQKKVPEPEVVPIQEGHVTTLVLSIDESETLLIITNDQGQIELTSVLPKESVTDVNELLSEISDMRAFYDKKSKGNKISRIFLTGEAVSEQLLGQITSQLGVPAQFLRVPNAAVSASDSLSFFPAYALTDLPIVFPKDHIYINLLPEETLALEEQKKVARFHWWLVHLATVFFGVCTAIFVLLFGFLFWNGQTLGGKIAKEKEALANSKFSTLQSTANSVNKHLAIIKSLKDRDDHVLGVLSFLSEKTPGGITVSQYKIDTTGRTVVINGQSIEREILLAFKGILEGEEVYQSIKIPLTSIEKRGAATFSLSFEVK